MEKPMHRRNIIMGAFTAAGALMAAATRGRANAADTDKPKVVYHLCDLDKVAFVLGNIRNHFEGMGGADKVTIELVVHGPALKAFHAASANADVARRFGEFSKAGLAAQAGADPASRPARGRFRPCRADTPQRRSHMYRTTRRS